MRCCCFLIVVLTGYLQIPVSAQERPNILWISCEDISPHLGCYGDTTASTPNLDKLAAEGTMFTHAFSCHGVCAPSRTGIITGMSPVSLGANHMRSKAKLPDHIKLFPQYLQEAGYYCTNNSKTDYNLIWDENATWSANSGKAHWKNRPDSKMPFFSVFNLTMTHESKVWPNGWVDVVKELPESKRHRPEDMAVPPLYPDTTAVREDLARLADLISVMDRRAGELLKELEDSGLSDETIVVFWSDHGDGLPRSKRWTYDSGSRVPLIVRVPEKYQALAGAMKPGSKDDRLISLIDLGPTILQLSGIEPPPHMQGIPFLGPDASKTRNYIYGARDRLDERFDMVRTVRTRTHRYVRNLMPWRPALQEIEYGERNGIMKEMRRLLATEKLAPASAQWFQTPRKAEELYDLAADPWELVNLADHPDHQKTLEILRSECDRWQIEVRDAHLLPEIMLDEAEQSLGSRWQIFQGPAGEQRLSNLLDAAKKTSHLDHDTAKQTMNSLDSDPAIRWWQVTMLGRTANARERVDVLEKATRDTDASVRIVAAAGLLKTGQSESALRVLQESLGSKSQFVRHATMLEIDEAGPSVIRLLSDKLTAGKDEEYVERLVLHARGQL